MSRVCPINSLFFFVTNRYVNGEEWEIDIFFLFFSLLTFFFFFKEKIFFTRRCHDPFVHWVAATTCRNDPKLLSRMCIQIIESDAIR